MGFTAVNNSFTAQAVALFLILFMWQMPHFLAIAILYKMTTPPAEFKMLPNVNEDVTARQMVFYAMALIPISLTPVLLGMAGGSLFRRRHAARFDVPRLRPFAARNERALSARQLFFRLDHLSPGSAHGSGGESDLSMFRSTGTIRFAMLLVACGAMYLEGCQSHSILPPRPPLQSSPATA